MAIGEAEMGQKLVFWVKMIPTFFWEGTDSEQITALSVTNG